MARSRRLHIRLKKRSLIPLWLIELIATTYISATLGQRIASTKTQHAHKKPGGLAIYALTIEIACIVLIFAESALLAFDHLTILTSLWLNIVKVGLKVPSFGWQLSVSIRSHPKFRLGVFGVLYLVFS